jgi:hypothetical protein
MNLLSSVRKKSKLCVIAAMEDLVRAREAVRIPDRDGVIIRRGL